MLDAVDVLALAVLALCWVIARLLRQVGKLEARAEQLEAFDQISGQAHLRTTEACGIWFGIVEELAAREAARSAPLRPRPRAQA